MSGKSSSYSSRPSSGGSDGSKSSRSYETSKSSKSDSSAWGGSSKKLSEVVKQTKSKIPMPTSAPKYAKSRDDSGAYNYFKRKEEEEAKKKRDNKGK